MPYIKEYKDVNRVFRNKLLKAAYFLNCKDPKKNVRDKIMVDKNRLVTNPSIDVREEHRKHMISHYLVCPTIQKQRNNGGLSPLQNISLEHLFVAFRIRKRCLYCGKKSNSIIKEHEVEEYKLRNITLSKANQLDANHTFKYGDMNYRISAS